MPRMQFEYIHLADLREVVHKLPLRVYVYMCQGLCRHVCLCVYIYAYMQRHVCKMYVFLNVCTYTYLHIKIHKNNCELC